MVQNRLRKFFNGGALDIIVTLVAESEADYKNIWQAKISQRGDMLYRLGRAGDKPRHRRRVMQDYGTELIAPNKQNRRVPTQDGRPLRRFVRRWKIERLFAWLFNFRRLAVRYEYHAENFQDLVHLAAALILLRHS